MNYVQEITERMICMPRLLGDVTLKIRVVERRLCTMATRVKLYTLEARAT